MKKILFTGGGSAGHVVPNIALISLILRSGEADCCYAGTNGIEFRLISPLKIPYFVFSAPKLSREFSWGNLAIPARLWQAKKRAAECLTAFKPDVVFSKGGYVALPVVLAAAKMGIPCLTHESDLSLGLANKLMAKKCQNILTSFPETAKKVKNGKFVGSPLRSELFDGDKKSALQKYGFSGKRKVLLVFGGGSGSKQINETLRKHLFELTKTYDILHLCGVGGGTHDRIRGYVQLEYEYDMASAYAAADGVVCRSGSNTAFEVIALKKPTLFIPLETASRGDQVQNADYFASQGLAHVLKRDYALSFPDAVRQMMQDEKLPIALQSATYQNGNENILREIRRYL